MPRKRQPSTPSRAHRSPRAVLGVPEDAPLSECRHAHRRLVLRYHPDRNVGDDEAAERLKEANEAYADLTGRGGDPDNRSGHEFLFLMSLVGETINQLVAAGKNPSQINLAGMLRDLVRDRLRATHEASVAIQAHIKALADVKGRFRGRAAGDIDSIIDLHLVQMHVKANDSQHMIELLESVQSKLADCSFQFTPPTHGAPTSSGIFVFNSGATGSNTSDFWTQASNFWNQQKGKRNK